MRLAVVLIGVLVVSSCADDAESSRVPVVVRGVDVSDDRRTLTVWTTYPTNRFCAKQPGGVDIEINGQVAIVTANVMRQADFRDGDACTLECGIVTQHVTLNEPIADGIRFDYPSNANPGC